MAENRRVMAERQNDSHGQSADSSRGERCAFIRVRPQRPGLLGHLGSTLRAGSWADKSFPRTRDMGCRVHTTAPQWPEMPESLSSGLRIQAFALTHQGLLPELKLGKGCVCAGSKEKNAGFLSLIKKPPLHPLMKTSCLFAH